MRYIRITRVLNREENYYVLNRDVCYYCTATANISIRLRTVEASTRVFERLWNIIFGNFFFLFNQTSTEEFSSNRDILGSSARSFSPSGWSKDQLAFDLTSSFFFVCVVGIEKRQTKMNLHGSFRSCSTKYTESLACHRWNRTVTRRKLILEIILVPYCKLPGNHSLTDFDEQYRQDDFSSPKFNANRISRSKFASTKYFVKSVISSQKYAKNICPFHKDSRQLYLLPCLRFFFFFISKTFTTRYSLRKSSR